MGFIADRERAARLARAILSDLHLYHSEEIREHAPSMVEHIAEGRVLFRSRVAPPLHDEFEAALRASELAPWAGASPDDGGFTYRDPPPALEQPRERNSAVPVFVAVVVLAVAAAVMAVLNR